VLGIRSKAKKCVYTVIQTDPNFFFIAKDLFFPKMFSFQPKLVITVHLLSFNPPTKEVLGIMSSIAVDT
jgi:hypothetical protein